MSLISVSRNASRVYQSFCRQGWMSIGIKMNINTPSNGSNSNNDNKNEFNMSGSATRVDPPSQEPAIPSGFSTRDNESVDTKRARLMYQSRKRGMLENDLLLGTFAGLYLSRLNEKQLCLYDFIINMPSNDWDLYNWSVGLKPVPQLFQNEVMDMLIEHCRNNDREKRLRQPDL